MRIKVFPQLVVSQLNSWISKIYPKLMELYLTNNTINRPNCSLHISSCNKRLSQTLVPWLPRVLLSSSNKKRSKDLLLSSRDSRQWMLWLQISNTFWCLKDRWHTLSTMLALTAFPWQIHLQDWIVRSSLWASSKEERIHHFIKTILLTIFHHLA